MLEKIAGQAAMNNKGSVNGVVQMAIAVEKTV
jgi:hypothetical protein